MASERGVTRRPLLGTLLLAVTVLTGVSLMTSPPWPGARGFVLLPEHACGTVGIVTAKFLLGRLGGPLGLWVVLVAAAVSLRCLLRHPIRPWLFLVWSGLTALTLSVFAASFSPAPPWGDLPRLLGGRLRSPNLLGPVGAGLATGAVLLLLLLVGFLRWVPSKTRARAGEWMGSGTRGVGTALGGAVTGIGRRAAEAASEARRRRRDRAMEGREVREQERAAREAAKARAREERDARRRAAAEAGSDPVVVEQVRKEAVRGTGGEPRGVGASGELFLRPSEALAGSSGRAGTDSGSSGRGGAADVTVGPPPVTAGEAAVAGGSRGASADRAPRRSRVAREAAQAGAAAAEEAGGEYVLPPVELLELGAAPPPVDRGELLETSRTLVRTLKDFGILGQVGQIHPGPIVTQYEFEPAAGIKISQIVSRADDLALALRVPRVRLVAPIPGKAAVGIEAPNRSPAVISLRPILQEIDLPGLPGELPLVFGRDIRGRAFHSRLEQMPHLLVAGTTGSGKSVFLNCILLSLLLRKTPNDLRLLLIDPKMLELTPYDGIPHLACPVVTEAKIAARMLTWAVGEMERRYRRLAAVGVRSLEGYRQKIRSARDDAAGLEAMPHIVIIVDELADLMLTVANEVEGPIARLAQMARAVGIHLILATQRPSVDVITGVIKANFPARVGFQVASKVDSRTILDTNGAESLLGRGDMLFIPPGKAEAVRVHGAFVSDRDTESVAAFWREQPAAADLIPEDGLEATGGDPEMEDELYEDALRLVILQKQASTSFLQRRLKVGYSRAGRLMDLLEQTGAVGPPDGSKPREVLANEAFLDSWRNREGSDAANTLG